MVKLWYLLICVSKVILGMAEKKRLVRVTISLDKDDYASVGALAEQVEISSSWLIRQAIRDFLDKYGEHGQPELALRLARKRAT